MSKSYYQIDRYAGAEAAVAGISDMHCDMILSTSRKQALVDYLTKLGYVVDDADSPVVIGDMAIRGQIAVVATCPADTASVWSATCAR